jgi:hypothetical protein
MSSQLTSDAISSSQRGNTRSLKPVFVKTGMHEAGAEERGVYLNSSATAILS